MIRKMILATLLIVAGLGAAPAAASPTECIRPIPPVVGGAGGTVTVPPVTTPPAAVGGSASGQADVTADARLCDVTAGVQAQVDAAAKATTGAVNATVTKVGTEVNASAKATTQAVTGWFAKIKSFLCL